METLKKQTRFLILAIFCMDWLSLLSKTVKGDEKFSYDPCSEKGPKYWGELKEEWEICKIGKIQSPIALSKWTADYYEALSDLSIDHKPAKAYLNNDGHEIIVEWTGNAGSIKIYNMDYQLQNFHWHHPSEHTQDGKTYPLELHMVHINNVTNDKAVIGILFEYGSPDPFISLIETDIKDLEIEGAKKCLGKMDPRIAMADGIRKYFRYIGSLTTPPCTEGVVWTVMEKVQTVSPDQVELLKHAVVEERNARPLQKVNGRVVFYFDPFSRRSVAAE